MCARHELRGRFRVALPWLSSVITSSCHQTGLCAVFVVLQLTRADTGLAMFYGGMVQARRCCHDSHALCLTPAAAQELFAHGYAVLHHHLPDHLHLDGVRCATADTSRVVVLTTLRTGYSLAFRPGTKVIGGSSRFWLLGMEIYSIHPLAPTIPESVFMARELVLNEAVFDAPLCPSPPQTFQMTFAIITPALIVGGLAERMKFSALIVFMAAWSLIVYCPIAHSVWALDGFLHEAGILDFAGGGVVHLNSGVAALMCALCLGKRHGHGNNRFEPHNASISLIGVSFLWVGWFGAPRRGRAAVFGFPR